MIDESLKPYLTYSAAAHAGLALAFAVALGRQPSAGPDQIYHIDFIGPTTTTVVNREREAARKGPAPQAKAGEIARRRAPLPRPSFLEPSPTELPVVKKAAPAEPISEPAPEAPPAPAAPTTAKTDEQPPAAAAPAGAAVESDMPNFPYPWYITQVRTSLWSQWSARMPPGGGEATVMFSILRTGRLTDLRVESSSGDGGFDNVALTAVQEAAPFPPLPRGFSESFLKVHVKFTSQ